MGRQPRIVLMASLLWLTWPAAGAEPAASAIAKAEAEAAQVEAAWIQALGRSKHALTFVEQPHRLEVRTESVPDEGPAVASRWRVQRVDMSGNSFMLVASHVASSDAEFPGDRRRFPDWSLTVAGRLDGPTAEVRAATFNFGDKAQYWRIAAAAAIPADALSLEEPAPGGGASWEPGLPRVTTLDAIVSDDVLERNRELARRAELEAGEREAEARAPDWQSRGISDDCLGGWTSELGTPPGIDNDPC